MILILRGEEVVTGHQLFKVGIHSLGGIFLLYLHQALLHHHHLVHQIMNQTICNEDSEGNKGTQASLVNLGEEAHKVIEESKAELVLKEGEVIAVLLVLQVLLELILMGQQINHLLLNLLHLSSKERLNRNTYQPGMGMPTPQYLTFGQSAILLD